MRSARWLLYLWPGLPQLWWRGAWSALAAAVCFAIALDVALLATWYWSELLAASLRPFVWPMLSLVWVGGMAGTAWRGLSAAAASDANEREDLFPRTLGEYLRGNWLEAEILCRRLVERDAGDAEALLLLATVLRHSGRLNEARSALAQLLRLDAAAAWEQEIREELARLSAAHPEIQENGKLETNHESQTDPTDPQERQEPDEDQQPPTAEVHSVKTSPIPTIVTSATKPKLLDAA